MNTQKHIFIVLLAVFFTVNINAQTLTDNIGGDFQYIVDDGTSNPMATESTVTGLTERIWLTDQDNIKGGSVPTDIFYDDNTGNVFIYGKRNIAVYDVSQNKLTARIALEYEDNNGDIQVESAQFYPTIEESQYLDDNHFAYKFDSNTGVGTLYCVTENLNVYAINTNSSTFDCQLVIPSSLMSGISYHYNTFIKYHNNRLYLAFTTNVGSLKSNFYVYDVDNNYDPVGELSFENGTGSDQIRGLEINTATGANEFFLSIDNAFYSFTHDPNFYNITQTQIGSTYSATNGAGNMLYINEVNLHKLFCFPNGGTGNQNFFIKDLSSGGQPSSIQCPANITSACFDGTDKVYLSYKSTTGSPDLRTISATNYATIDSDIYTQGVNDINTRTVSGNDYTLDMEMLDGQLIITKESEVCQYNRTPTSPDLHVSPMSQGKNNYFNRVVENNNKAYVIGTWSSELDVFTTSSGQVGNSIELGGIVFKACHNPDRNKIYFYNTHVQDNSKIYILNTTDNSIDMLELDGSIADIEIDPTTNNALVSTGDASNNIKVISGNTNLLISPLDLGNYGHIGEMFVSSNNLLYCIIRENGTNQAGIIVWDLNQSGNNPIDFYDYNTGGNPIRGCFSPHNSAGQKASYDYVYAVINIPGTTNAPFATRFRDDQYDPQLVENINLPQGNYIDIEHYDKYVYVAKQDASRTVVLLDQSSWTVFSTLSIPGLVAHKITDLEVNIDKSLVYVLNGPNISKISGANLLSSQMDVFNENTNSLKYNKENQRLYVYLPYGCVGCGVGTGGVYDVFDDDAGSNGWLFYPNGDIPKKRYTDGYAPLHHDMIIDNNTNKLYYGGGGNSCISMVDLENTYVLLLRQDKEVTWLSIPRHYHTSVPLHLPNSTLTEIVFDPDNIDEDYTVLDLDYNLIRTNTITDEHYPTDVDAIWENNIWSYSYVGNMNDIVSTRGYILNPLEGWTGNNFLHLYGTIEDPNTKIDLYCGQENWVGYFIPEVQDVFDALGDELGNLNIIKHQDYTCVRTIQQAPCMGTKSTLSSQPQGWVCSDRHNIKYGDMLMLTPVHDNFIGDGEGMHWNWSENPPSENTRPELTYYEPEVEATYTSMTIELDSTDNPQEIGAFVNDSCVGACSVLPEDTLVVMQAYLGDQSGDSVTFRVHFASREINEREVRDYFVLDLENMQKEKRAVKTGEGKPLIMVSFKKWKTKEEKLIENLMGFNVYPNPATDKISFSLTVQEELDLRISIFSINGKLVSMPIEQKIESGFISSEIKLLDNSGNKLKPGIYVLKADIGKITEVKKLIIK